MFIFSVPAPDILCTDQRITAVFDRRIEQRLELEHLSLADTDAEFNETECGYEESMDDNYIRVSMPFVGCGTQRLVGLL